MLYRRVGNPKRQLLTLNLTCFVVQKKGIMFYSPEEKKRKVEFYCKAIAIQKSLSWRCYVRYGG